MSLELNALYRRFAGDLANLDFQEARATEQRDTQKRDLADEQRTSLERLANRMAGQGLTHSGIALDQNVQARRAFERAGSDIDRQHLTNLTNIARKRLEAENKNREDRALLDMSKLILGG